jgi:hypothetical protein
MFTLLGSGRRNVSELSAMLVTLFLRKIAWEQFLYGELCFRHFAQKSLSTTHLL